MQKIEETSWSIRLAEAHELPFIYATWLNSYRYDSFIGKACKNSIFFAEYPKIIDAILESEMTKVLVAFFPASPKVILSYIVFDPSCLHYVFTKEIYQKNGIAMSLVLMAFKDRMSHPISYSHRTLMAEPILQKYQDQLMFNPFKLYQRLNSEGDHHVSSH